MKLAVVGFESLEDFLMGLPFLKGLRDIYMDAEIVVEGPDHYRKMKDFCIYIADIVPKINREEYKIVIDLNRSQGLENYQKFHRADQLLSLLPAHARRRQVLIKETVVGFESVKKIFHEDFDLVLYPFSSEGSDVESEKDFLTFLTYFYQMNPGKRVCVAGFEHQKQLLEKFKKDERLPKDLVQVETCSLDKMVSLVNRSAYVITADSSVKYLVTNDSVTLIETKDKDEEFYRNCAYRENTYLVHFKKAFKNKVVYTYDEMVFDSATHFLSYLVTSILDEDEEKMRWFAEKYTGFVDIFRTKIDAQLGLRLIPVHWSGVNILRALVDTALRMKLVNINKPHFAEEFYFYIHDDSDFSQEKIIFDLDSVRKFLEQLLVFFRDSNEFARQLKMKNTAQSSLEEAIFGLTQAPEDVVTVLFFIRQVMNVASQKLLENLPMTASYYS